VVKFLSGTQYDGELVPLCTYWRNDLTTDPNLDIAPLEGTGETFAQLGEGQDSAIGDFNGQCIANAFFARDDISCFNAGRCNEEGKCLPCTKYTYGGMRMAISHSPPIDILREFAKGATEAELQSPNLAAFPPGTINRVDQDQLPYHIIVRNVQAEIAKCCHWNVGDGLASRFFLAQIINDPGLETREFNDVNGNPVFVRGIVVINPEFPDEVGTFFPAGIVVVAGFEDQPSFYLEPRTGLTKPGEGVIFKDGNPRSPSERAKSLAGNSTQLVTDAVISSQFAASTAAGALEQATNFENAAIASNDLALIAIATADREEAEEKLEAADGARVNAETLGTEAIDEISAVLETENAQDTFDAAKTLADTLDELADELEISALNAGDASSSETASAQVGLLRARARELRFVGFAGASKCEFIEDDNNVALQWNAPTDGTLPCNGVRTDCDFYTGEEWEFATDEKMSIGQPVTGDQLQELRFRSDNWSRFTDPAAEFENRFSTPFIWAFKEYTNVNGVPLVENMSLYRPKLLFGRDLFDTTPDFETILLEKIEIVNFEDFTLNKSESRITGGSNTLNKDIAPSFPSIITEPVVPANTRLEILHPRREDLPFVYRTWSSDKNLISLFGEATSEATIYIVNDTALQNRNRYNAFLGTRNFTTIPTALPRKPTFTGITANSLLAIFNALEEEQSLNDSAAPLGFHKVAVNREGTWQSTNTVDLVHNEINEIFVFLLIDDVNFIFDSTKIDYRFLHALMQQTTFDAKDFSIQDATGSTFFGQQATNLVDGAKLEAEASQILPIGEAAESLDINQFYFGLRFEDRNITAGTLQQPLDLQGAAKVADTDPTAGITFQESPAKELVTRVGYNVVQYRRDIEVEDWYVINNCGDIMLRLEDDVLHRVLPLPDQTGEQTALRDVLVNGGGKGSVVAQWALEKVTLTFKGDPKELGQIFRDPDGVGLPANYVVVGPIPGSDVENFFGRPEIDRDSINITVTFLRAQTAGLEGGEAGEDEEEGAENGDETDPRANDPELGDEVVKNNFHGDNLLFTTNISNLEGNFFTAGSDVRPNDIQADQQDYVFVFADGEGRPIGRKVTRFMCMYAMLAVIPVEIQYQWRTACTKYALFPDIDLFVGTSDGTVTSAPKGTTNTDDLIEGFRINPDNIGDKLVCVNDPSCGDHENLDMGPRLVEFETIITSDEFPIGKIFYPSAGQQVPQEVPPTPADPETGEGGSFGVFITQREPPTQFLRKRGPLWYPYVICERPRYKFGTGGPLSTESTELMNTELEPAGITAAFQRAGTIEDGQAQASPGVFGGAVPPSDEAYRGPDLVKPSILDVHPRLRLCQSAFTYANTVVTSPNQFTGYARQRGAIDPFWFADKGWVPPPFGNRSRNQLIVEITERRGDYAFDPAGAATAGVSFRWMPMFPVRDDLGAGIGLFGEEMEPQHYRLLCSTSPAGAIDEVAPTRDSPRFTHKSLVFNRTLAGIEYPFFPYYPTFLPDGSIGLEPEDRGGDIPEGRGGIAERTTMWAWREQEKPITRGVGGEVISGLRFQSPDYIIDNRRMEVRLRPSEGIHTIKYLAPQYNDQGEQIRHAALQLDDGPLRFVSIDFIERNVAFRLAPIPGTEAEDAAVSFYDTSKILGEGLLECEEGTASDNLSQFAKCSCETDTKSDNVDSENLPARFFHLQEAAPEGLLVLYESDEIQTPFLIDLVRGEVADPCCVCSYYIRGLFFSLNTNFLPLNENIDLAFDSRFTADQTFLYTWSRVPHGFPTGIGQDGAFNATENHADDYLKFDTGRVFINRFVEGANSIDTENATAAFFPSPEFAAENKISVAGLPADDPKLKGGIPVDDDGFSQGQPESIILDMAFDTYVRIRQVTIRFVAGAGFEVPELLLFIIDPALRTGQAVTLRTGRQIARSTVKAVGTDIPNAGNFNSADIRSGSVLFTVNIVPSYASVPFWNQFGGEFHLAFGARAGDLSMGIATVEVTADTMLGDEVITENIFVNERRYYASTGSPAAGENPESRLGGMDTASAYWRTADVGAIKGGNRHRANGFSTKLTEDGPIIRGDPRGLEKIQSDVYNDARDLLSTPYTWTFTSFSPLDEAEAIDFFGGEFLDKPLSMTLETSQVDEISRHVVDATEADLLYGKVPDREPWNAPGHAWTFTLVEAYKFCGAFGDQSMTIDFNFSHLHDGLKTVETALFWDELPTGFNRIFRSTMLSPDASFGGVLATRTDGGTAVGPTIMDASVFLDSQGNPIQDDVLANSGFRKSPDGDTYIFETGGE